MIEERPLVSLAGFMAALVFPEFVKGAGGPIGFKVPALRLFEAWRRSLCEEDPRCPIGTRLAAFWACSTRWPGALLEVLSAGPQSLDLGPSACKFLWAESSWKVSEQEAACRAV